MNTESLSLDDNSNDEAGIDFGHDPYGSMPVEIRDSLTEHFLALMGAEPLQQHERLAA